MPNSAGPSSQSGGGNPALQVQPITPQLLTNAQGQIIATVIGNQILPVINTQGITLSPIKPGQQVTYTVHWCTTHSYTGTYLGATYFIVNLMIHRWSRADFKTVEWAAPSGVMPELCLFLKGIFQLSSWGLFYAKRLMFSLVQHS